MKGLYQIGKRVTFVNSRETMPKTWGTV